MKIKSELKPYLKSLFLGFSFFVLLCGYQTTQNFQSGINEKYGYISVALVYGCYGIGQFITPAIIQWLTPKYSLIAAGLCYLFYIATNIKVIIPLYLIASAVCGFGASLLWSSSSTLLSGYEQNAKTTSNIYTFFYVPTYMNFIGNFIPLVFSPENPQRLFIVLTIVSGIAVVLFIFSTNSPPKKVDKTFDLLVSTISNFRNWKLGLFFPLAILFGCSRSFYYTSMPVLAPVEFTPYIFICNGLMMTCTTFVWGSINKFFGEKISLLVAILFEMVACCIGFIINETFSYVSADFSEIDDPIPLVCCCCVLGAVAGICDSGLEVVSTAIINKIYPKQVAPLCAWRIIYLGVMCISLVYSAYCSTRVILIIFAISTILAFGFMIVVIVIYNKVYKPLEEQGKELLRQLGQEEKEEREPKTEESKLLIENEQKNEEINEEVEIVLDQRELKDDEEKNDNNKVDDKHEEEEEEK